MNPPIDLSSEAATNWGEWGVVIAVAVIAGIYLWRRFFVKKGCSGCAQGGQCGKKMPCGE
ncbi:MAG: hypothetical protein Q4G42_05585 [Neisseria sp.]|nr:hypothetical protein [Neisseria sp.]